MALETATYLDALVLANPAGGDLLATGDDHARLLKACLQRTFPKIASEMSASSVELNLLAGAAALGLSAGNVVYCNDLTSAVQAQLNVRPVIAHQGDLHRRSTRTISGTHALKTDAWNSLIFLSASANVHIAFGLQASRSWSNGVEIELLQLASGSAGVVVDSGVKIRGPDGQEVSSNDAIYLSGIGARAIMRYRGSDLWTIQGDIV